jgi:hypothetical protein
MCSDQYASRPVYCSTVAIFHRLQAEKIYQLMLRYSLRAIIKEPHLVMYPNANTLVTARSMNSDVIGVHLLIHSKTFQAMSSKASNT